MASNHPSLQLPEVVSAFGGAPEASVTPLGEGMVNTTWLVESVDSDRFVLQKLNKVFDERMVRDTARVSEHLRRLDWEVPQVLPTQSGALWHTDVAGDLWRASSFITSEAVSYEELSTEQLRYVGDLLGHFHVTLHTLDYQPEFTLPHFHDTPHYVSHLRENLPKLPDQQTTKLTHWLLEEYKNTPDVPTAEPQLVHGDPQLNNMLFRDGKPFTLIDLDTVMRGSVWVDVGDLLRSLLQADARKGAPLDIVAIETVAESYRNAAMPEQDPATFMKAARTATRLLAVELSIRFMNDIVDDNYFSWDSSRYADRRENHLAEIGFQRQIIDSLDAGE